MKEFHDALERNDVETIKRIIKEVGPNCFISNDHNSGYKYPLLYWAMNRYGAPQPEIVEALLESGADPNFFSQSKYHYASILSRFLESVVDDYKDNSRDRFEGRLKIARSLARHNVKPQAKDFEYFEHHLLHYNVDSDASTSSTETINLDCVKIYRGSPFLNKVLKLFYDPTICKFKEFWLPPRWSVTEKDKDIILTPSEEFVYAIIRGDIEKAKSLLDAKLVDANRVISDGRTSLPPLSHAIVRRYYGDENVAMVKMLLTYGANPNSILRSIIERLCGRVDYTIDEVDINRLQIARLLLEQGAKPTKADLQYIEKHLIGELVGEENETFYVWGTKPLADVIIKLFNDPAVYNIKFIKLESDDLELYRLCKETNGRLGGLEFFLMLRKLSDVTIDPFHMEEKLSATLPVELAAKNTSLEQAILKRDPKALSQATPQPYKRIETNIKVANQLLKGIIKTKVWEVRLEELAETVSYYLPG